MILRNSNTGGIEVYDISNNQMTGAAFLGTVGLEWQFSGVGNFSGRGESDMILRNANTGGLEVYDIANNQLTGAAFIGLHEPYTNLTRQKLSGQLRLNVSARACDGGLWRR